jgi:hypothetical protein
MDKYRTLASKIFNKTSEEISSDQRRIAKTIGFGTSYGGYLKMNTKKELDNIENFVSGLSKEQFDTLFRKNLSSEFPDLDMDWEDVRQTQESIKDSFNLLDYDTFEKRLFAFLDSQGKSPSEEKR